MVEILSLGGDYDHLGIEPGFSCLYVFKQDSTWIAGLVAFGRMRRIVARPGGRTDQPYQELSIKRTSARDMKLEWKDFPAVARWEWDAESNTHVIGFGCLDGWCEAGELGRRSGNRTGPDWHDGGIAGLSDSPVFKVKAGTTSSDFPRQRATGGNPEQARDPW
jgi:hypothetical protein